jgi:phage shock protein A
MSDIAPPTYEKKSFWKRPEGVTGAIFLLAVLGGLGYLLAVNMTAILALAANTIYLVLMLMALAALIYVILDPKMRNLIWYMYKSVMRWVTGVFVQIDPVGILKSYVEDLQDNLGKMSQQIGNLKGQIRKMSTLMEENNKEISNSLKLASVAKQQNNESQVVLATRKAARLQETNEKYAALHGKMEILYRILDKMYKNSEILLEDTRDQVKLKEQERKAIRASHSAMKSAMSVISGDPDKRAMFDAAIENIADDVANKVGEMERFMEMSANFMDSIDLQQGVFQEEGLRMLEEWEEKSTLMLLSPKSSSNESLDLNRPTARPEKQGRGDGTSYDNLFN